ncbi:MAG: transporter [Hyphomicrobium sp.]|uniref:SphA family protein n=1 Tax=Hyphomicrobium sp. TaxID=82 RepID=UPI0039E2BAE6
MRMKRLIAATTFVSVAAIYASEPVHATEGVTPLLGGVTIGVPAGAAPPPGLYSSTTLFYLQGDLKNGSGQKTPLKLNEIEVSETLLLSTSLEMFGGQLYGYIVQPYKGVTKEIGGTKDWQSGAFNTIVSPVNLSWNLGGGYFFSAGAAFYLPNGTYSPTGTKAANGYFTFEPTAAITYLKDGYHFTANAVLDINSENSDTNYKSGNDFGIDFTATKAFGNWSLGAGGYVVQQFENDKVNGQVVPASSFNGRGNKWSEIGIGPYASYNFGDFQVSAWATFDVLAKNTISSNIGWVRLSVPLGNPLKE